MARRFLMATGLMDRVVERRVVRCFDKNQIKWWHWLPHNWLLLADDETSAAKIRSEVYDLDPTVETLVMEIKGDTDWATATFKRSGREMSDWLAANWDPLG